MESSNTGPGEAGCTMMSVPALSARWLSLAHGLVELVYSKFIQAHS
jgi:hypothetical protein